MKSSKKIVVCVRDGQIRILTNPPYGDYCNLEHIVDPDLKKVRGLPPHLWKIEDGEVLPSVPHVALPLDPEPEAEPAPAPVKKAEEAPAPAHSDVGRDIAVIALAVALLAYVALLIFGGPLK
jgi:hypothetical protein